MAKYLCLGFIHQYKTSLITKFQCFLYQRSKSPRGRNQLSRQAAAWNPVRRPEAALAAAAAAGAGAGGPHPADRAAQAQEVPRRRSLCHWMKKVSGQRFLCA
jgi:hypothetical protein